MGKKSRRSNDEKSNTSTRKLKASIRNLVQTMEGLFENQDWKGVVSLAESQKQEVLLVLSSSSVFVYQFSAFYFHTAVSHMKLGNSKKAIIFYEKTIQTTTKPSSEEDTVRATITRQTCESCLVDCYLAESRCRESAALVRKFTPYDKLSNPQCLQKTLDFFSCLISRDEYEVVLELAEEYMKEHKKNPKKKGGKNFIEFNMLKTIGRCHQDLNDFHKAIAVLKQIHESCPFEMSIAFKEADIMSNLGRSYGSLGDFEKATYYLERTMLLVSNHGLAKLFEIYKEIVINMAEIHFNLEKHENEAIEGYKSALKVIRGDAPQSPDITLPYIGSEHLCGKIHRSIGIAHLRLKAWNEAIEALQHSISLLTKSKVEKYRDAELCKSYQELGRAHLERYCGDEELAHIPKERKNALELSLHFSQKALTLIGRETSCDRNVYLDLAQENYLLGDMHQSHEMLKQFLDFAVHAGPLYCQGCHQTSPKEDMMQVCKGCKVASYCSCAHQSQAWKKERIGHRKMCNLLQTWRGVKKGRKSVESCSIMFDKYFASTFRTMIIRSSSPSEKRVQVKAQERLDGTMTRNEASDQRETLLCID